MKKSHLTEALALFVFALATFILLFTWHKRRSDRAGCIINIRNVQHAVRAYHGINCTIRNTEEMWNTIFTGPDAYMKRPVCPSGGTYTFSITNLNPPVGEVFCTCSHAETLNHKPDHTTDW